MKALATPQELALALRAAAASLSSGQNSPFANHIRKLFGKTPLELSMILLDTAEEISDGNAILVSPGRGEQ